MTKDVASLLWANSEHIRKIESENADLRKQVEELTRRLNVAVEFVDTMLKSMRDKNAFQITISFELIEDVLAQITKL